MKKVIETRKRTVTKTVTDELNGIRGLLAKYPTGILSMVSDTFDLWRMCTEYLPILKEEILARDGKLVIRPDSGNPVDIVCGYHRRDLTSVIKDDAGIRYANTNDKGEPISEYTKISEAEYKGVIELLWDAFGGTVNEQGYKVLDSHIGAIYGDSITIDRAEEICRRLEAKGFASTNIVLGVGSFTYQFNTRDTFGFAMKATYVEVNGEGREIFKDPITDDGMKKSATGLLYVGKGDVNGELKLFDKVTWETEAKGQLKTLYKDGNFEMTTTLTEIKNRLK